MSRTTERLRWWMCGGLAVSATMVHVAAAQDTRTVTEPVFPAACTVLQAQQAIGGNGEPTSETTLDTATIQSALNSAVTNCGAGSSVELTANGANNAFLTGPLTIPANVSLVVDGGVTLFGSRNPADYQSSTSGVETCGTVGTKGNGCLPLITASGANSGIMGYGVIDGRGQDKLLVNGTAATYSWWDQAGTAQNTSGGAQNNPILIMANAANLVLYKITVRNSPMFHVKWTGNLTNKTGFTAWGVKVITPFTARNSDGIDPSGANITITNSSLSDGDDMVAVSASSAAQNITVQNTNTFSGHGISVGSYTQGGLSNMLVQNIMQMGTAADKNAGGLRIKTSQDRGGLVQNVTYQNICIANTKSPIYLSPYYNTNSGTSYPQFTNITYRNVHVVTEGTVTLQGYANSGATVTRTATLNFDNFIFDTLQQSDFSPAPAYLGITLGPGPVSPLLQTQTGTGVSYSGSVTSPSTAAYACNPSSFQYLVGELYGSTITATNLQTVNVTSGAPVTLNAMLQPAMSQVSYTSISGGGTYTGTAAPTAAVQFKEGPNVVGSASVSGNGTLASVTLSNVTVGTHTYTAYYAGDTNYTVPLSFGSVTVNVSAPATSTSLGIQPSTATYGQVVTLSSTVTSAAGTPAGTVSFLNNGTVLGTASLSGGSASLPITPGAGSYNVTAAYQGNASFSASNSTAASLTVAPAVLTVTASSASRVFGMANPSLGATITGFVNGDTAATAVTGTPSLATSAVRISPAGSYGITAGPGSLAAPNYTFAFANGTLQVNGGAVQAINFPPLPNVPHGQTIMLLATASSGGNVSYSASGPATVSGNQLTVTGAGQVTVTASQGGNSNYAAASPVSVSFTAQ